MASPSRIKTVYLVFHPNQCRGFDGGEEGQGGVPLDPGAAGAPRQVPGGHRVAEVRQIHRCQKRSSCRIGQPGQQGQADQGQPGQQGQANQGQG